MASPVAPIGHISASFDVLNLIRRVAAVVPHSGPLFKIVGKMEELTAVVLDVRDIKNSCLLLVMDILQFVTDLINEKAQLNVPVQFGVATTAVLLALLEYVLQSAHYVLVSHFLNS